MTAPRSHRLHAGQGDGWRSAGLRVYVHPFGDFTASNRPGAWAAIVRSPWAKRAPASWYSGISDGCSRLSRFFSALASFPAGISPSVGRPPRLSASPRILTSFDRIDRCIEQQMKLKRIFCFNQGCSDCDGSSIVTRISSQCEAATRAFWRDGAGPADGLEQLAVALPCPPFTTCNRRGRIAPAVRHRRRGNHGA